MTEKPMVKEKYPWMKWYPGDWLKDPHVSMLSSASRGAWFDLLCAMHESGRSGMLCGTTDQLARIARCTTAEFAHALTEFQATGVAEVTERNNCVTVINRRMYREFKDRENNRLRQKKFRVTHEKQKSNDHVTVQKSEVRSQKSENTVIANAIPGTDVPAPAKKQQNGFNQQENDLRREFEELVLPGQAIEAWKVVKQFIEEKKPAFIEPYTTAWNIFSSWYKFPEVKKINDARRRKFRTRIRDRDFNFLEILDKAKRSELIKNGGWFNFDWIIENDSNYVKIIEGNYK